MGGAARAVDVTSYALEEDEQEPATTEPTTTESSDTAAMDLAFKALADPSRRQLLDSLNARRGQSLRELCAGLRMARQSVSKHLAILEAADLVVTVRRGREKLHYLNAAPINEIAERWITRYDRERARVIATLKHVLENEIVTGPETGPEFVYRTYIGTTPERLWQALTDPAFTRVWWRATEHATDWKVGSQMTWENNGVTIEDPEQVVLEYEPYRRLSYTWHSFTPELTKALGFADDLAASLRGERRSKVSFDIEPHGAKVKLTVRHDGFPPGSTAVDFVNEGWPAVLSDLKSLLETGAILPA
jgi:uncharacterized protein YndB with AHSA1/START domain/DNA-binding transcriptional ArsR family regulator